MTVTPLERLPLSNPADVDLPLASAPSAEAPLGAGPAPGSFGASLLAALDAAGNALGRADAAERAFAQGRGGLQEMVLERAQADVMLAVASAAASRTAQALTTVLGMQV